MTSVVCPAADNDAATPTDVVAGGYFRAIFSLNWCGVSVERATRTLRCNVNRRHLSVRLPPVAARVCALPFSLESTKLRDDSIAGETPWQLRLVLEVGHNGRCRKTNSEVRVVVTRRLDNGLLSFSGRRCTLYKSNNVILYALSRFVLNRFSASC